MQKNLSHYRIYLLRVWAERGRDHAFPVAWRFGLEDPRTGQRRGFANLAALVTALHQEIAKAAGVIGSD